MPDPGGHRTGVPTGSPRATAELLHAEIGFLLGAAGIPVLHVKGPTVARWLYPDGDRAWGDVDVWVPRRRLDDALAVLRRSGFDERNPGVNHRTTSDHAVDVARPDDRPGSGMIDVHHRFPGIDADPDAAFDLLWARRVRDELAHTPVWFPDLSSRAVITALNTARTPQSVQARGDLDRLVAPRSGVDWADAAALALSLGAGPGVRAGLELTPAGAELVGGGVLATVPVTTEWRLRTAGAGLTPLRLDQLRRLPRGQAVREVLRWAVPAPAVVRMRDGRARHGRSALVLAYLRRWAQGAGGLGRAVRSLRRADRAGRGHTHHRRSP